METNDRNEPTGDLITMVCVTCGAEQFFDAPPTTALRCPKCQGTVFRQFATPTVPDDVTLSRLEAEARSIQYGDSSPQTAPDEVHDLGQRGDTPR